MEKYLFDLLVEYSDGRMYEIATFRYYSDAETLLNDYKSAKFIDRVAIYDRYRDKIVIQWDLNEEKYIIYSRR